ncbi:MAG: hypothetical protein ACKVZJ_11980 [Phycisphaerales bacterium]
MKKTTPERAGGFGVLSAPNILIKARCVRTRGVVARCAAALLAAAAFIGPVGLARVAFAEPVPVRLAPSLEKGRVLTYKVERSLRLEQRPPADPRPLITVSRLEAVVRLEVGTVRADGTVEVGVGFESLTLQRDHAGEEMSFRHPAPAAPDPAPEPAPAPAPAPPPAEVEAEKPDGEAPGPTPYEFVGRAWVDARVRIVINREGEVQSMLGVEQVLEALKVADGAGGPGGGGLDEAELASLSPAGLGELLTPIFNPASPERPTRRFAPAETWLTQRTIDLATLGSVVTTESWTRGPDDAPRVNAEATISAEILPPRGIVTAAPTLKLDASAGSASIVWESAAGNLNAFEHRLMLGFTITLGDLKLEQTQVAATTITRRD